MELVLLWKDLGGPVSVIELSSMPLSCYSPGKDWSLALYWWGLSENPILSFFYLQGPLWHDGSKALAPTGAWGCVDGDSCALEQELGANPGLSPGPQPCPWSPSSCLLEPRGK